jgi:hypothetical protein
LRTSVFVGTSLDGFLARENGELDFLPPGGGEPHGYDEFMAEERMMIDEFAQEYVAYMGKTKRPIPGIW